MAAVENGGVENSRVENGHPGEFGGRLINDVLSIEDFKHCFCSSAPGVLWHLLLLGLLTGSHSCAATSDARIIFYSGLVGTLGMFTLLGTLAFATDRRKQGHRCETDMFGAFTLFLALFVRCYEPRLVTQRLFLTCLVLRAGLARLDFGKFGMFDPAAWDGCICVRFCICFLLHAAFALTDGAFMH